MSIFTVWWEAVGQYPQQGQQPAVNKSFIDYNYARDYIAQHQIPGMWHGHLEMSFAAPKTPTEVLRSGT